MCNTSLLQRISALLLAVLLLAAPVFAAQEFQYTMTIRDGFISVRNEADGSWVYCSQVHADSLSQRDQMLLKAGIPLNNQAEFTSAIEDFCS